MKLEYYDKRLGINTELVIKQVNKDKWEYSLSVEHELYKQLISCSPIHMNKKTNAYKMLKLLVNLYNIYNNMVTEERINQEIMPDLIRQYQQEVQNPLYVALSKLLTPPPTELIEKANESIESVNQFYKEYRLRNSNTTEKYFFTTIDLNHRLKDYTHYKSINDIDSELDNLYEQGLINILHHFYSSRGKAFVVCYLTDGQGIG